MNQKTVNYMEEKLSSKDYQKIMKINNTKLNDFIVKYIELCNPIKISVLIDSEEDLEYTRKAAVKNHEEAKLSTNGHTIHFDGFYDQARDKPKTKFLISKGKDLGSELNTMNRDIFLPWTNKFPFFYTLYSTYRFCICGS